jgi:hypothetical protein
MPEMGGSGFIAVALWAQDTSKRGTAIAASHTLMHARSRG